MNLGEPYWALTALDLYLYVLYQTNKTDTITFISDLHYWHNLLISQMYLFKKRKRFPSIFFHWIQRPPGDSRAESRPRLSPFHVFWFAVTGLLTASGWFYSAPVLISLRWHGGEADLIIVMVAGGSHPLHTSATASYLYTSRFTTGQPRALLLLNPTQHHLHLGFLSNYNHMRCKFFGELHGPFGSGSKTFSQRTTR